MKQTKNNASTLLNSRFFNSLFPDFYLFIYLFIFLCLYFTYFPVISKDEELEVLEYKDLKQRKNKPFWLFSSSMFCPAF